MIFKIKSIDCMDFLGQPPLGYQICIENGVVLISDVLLAKGHFFQGRKDWSMKAFGFAGKKKEEGCWFKAHVQLLH